MSPTDLPAAGSVLTVRTARCTNESGELLKALGDIVTLTIVNTGAGSLGFILARVNADFDSQRFVWGDISLGVVRQAFDPSG
jgi:hypothetical protein